MIRYFTVCSFGLVVWIIDEVVALILLSMVTGIFEQLKVEKNEFNLLRRVKKLFQDNGVLCLVLARSRNNRGSMYYEFEFQLTSNPKAQTSV